MPNVAKVLIRDFSLNPHFEKKNPIPEIIVAGLIFLNMIVWLFV
jgi:hypothetical protein